ncbi:ABC transporter ATP-binding protein [Actinosynnema mirum]|uniref:ABC transporter related n=1 Tax=Actinosynnema mirum (strain ATCC 29888 / DSM 43827 / JCM 3225 / NBRC 14064 / NCIMB 13271 / NRRL B-12336 / IMRU 3971 / 101) TaxID=446462 RepID=C6W7W5_ACTMD|nr:ATP-binding cassette domain-containing protein [Actinosynnema mirum]ACU36986.1 ABC transporter related [Actinosynnema mirum DSM 43827]
MSLRARDVWFRYGRTGPWVVRGVDLDVEPGEVVGLHGASGSGKSTLGRLLAGLDRPRRGVVEADGAAPRPGEGVPNPVQLAFQDAHSAMDPRWRVSEVLAETAPGGGAEVAALDPVLVPPALLDRFPHEISGGEAQRVNLARALLTSPRYLVADEITASLDAITQAVIWRLLLERVRADRIGVLAVSHDRPLLDAVADRVVDLAALQAEPAR